MPIETTPAATDSAPPTPSPTLPSPPPCPVCGALQWQSLGQVVLGIPVAVAGVDSGLADYPSALYRCGDCGLVYKWPHLPQEVLDACYVAADSTCGGWLAPADYRNFDLCKSLLLKHAPGRRILDVGCFHGAFLRFLGGEWDRNAVEPAIDAARVAAEAGIRILGTKLADIDPAEPFDCITAMDVVEHLPAVGDFFTQATARLKPGGVLLIETGDSGTFYWRLMGRRYWYSALPEHLAFPNRRCCERIAQLNGLQIVEYHQVRHGKATFSLWIRDWIKNLAYWAITRLGRTRIARLDRIFYGRKSPGWSSATDHMIMVFQKPR